MCKGPGAGAGLGIYDKQQGGWFAKAGRVRQYLALSSGASQSRRKGRVLGLPAHDRYWDRLPAGQRGLFVLGQCEDFPQYLGNKQLFLL